MKFKFSLIVLIALFSAYYGYGQNTLNNIGLTSSTPASVAFSLRQLSTSYIGPLVRIKVGASFYDVYPETSTKKFSLSSKISAAVSTYNAGVSVASTNALSTIISVSTDATVAIWYDQSGNGVNVLSNNATAKIITAGIINTVNGQATIYFNGSSSSLVSSTTVNYSAQTTATINAVAQNVASTDYISGIISTGSSGGWGLCYDPTNSHPGYWIDATGGNGAFSNEFTSETKIITGLIGTTTNSAIYINSQLKGTKVAQPISNGNSNNIYVGRRGGDIASRQFNGNISEIYMFPKNLSDVELFTLESSQSIFLPPTVTITSSASGVICANTEVTFTANSQNFSNTPTYQWYKNGIAISGATNATYTTSSISNNDQISVQATPGYTTGSISTTGLIANFDAANYNTTSTRWNDLSSSSNHMDFYTDRSYSTLKTATYSNDGGGSLIVNNNSVFGKTISNTGISGNGGKTMSAWVKIDATDQDWASVASIGEYVAAKVFEIYAERNGTNSQLIFHWAGGQVKANPYLPKNTWYNVTIKSDGSSNNYIFINGIQEGYSIQALNITNSPLYMGAPKTYNQGGWDYNFRGRISTLSLYNTALTNQTILDNYNATKGRYTTTSIASNTITTSITAGPSTPTITVTGDACINKTILSTTSGLTSYTWYKDNVAIAGATTNTYIPITAGAYKVVVSNGTCNTTSTPTTITNCGVTANGSMSPILTTLVSNEGGINFGTGINELGSLFNATGLTTTTGTIAATTAVIGGIISATNAVTSSIGVIYSTDANFGTYSSSTIQTNVVAGTYTTTITGLTGLTTYYAKSFIVNKAGTSYGPVVSFTTTTPPVAVGDVYGGGIVFYVLQPGDAGYDANVQHGLIAATQNQVTGGSFANVNNNINNPLYHTTAGSQFTDWRIPTLLEIQRLYSKKYLFGAFDYNSYYIINVPASFTNTSSSFYAYDMDNGNSGTGFGYPCNLRAIRSF